MLSLSLVVQRKRTVEANSKLPVMAGTDTSSYTAPISTNKRSSIISRQKLAANATVPIATPAIDTSSSYTFFDRMSSVPISANITTLMENVRFHVFDDVTFPSLHSLSALASSAASQVSAATALLSGSSNTARPVTWTSNADAAAMSPLKLSFLEPVSFGKRGLPRAVSAKAVPVAPKSGIVEDAHGAEALFTLTTLGSADFASIHFCFYLEDVLEDLMTFL